MQTIQFITYHELLNSKLSQIDTLDRVEIFVPTLIDNIEADYRYSHLTVIHNPSDREYTLRAYFQADPSQPVSLKGFFTEFGDTYGLPSPSSYVNLTENEVIRRPLRSATEHFVVTNQLEPDITRVLSAFATTRYQYMLDVTEPFAYITPDTIRVFLGNMYFKSCEVTQRQTRQNLFAVSYRNNMTDLTELPAVCDLDMYVRRHVDKLINHRLQNIVEPTMWANLYSVRFMLTQDLVINIKTSSTGYRSDDNSVALSQLFFARNAFPNYTAPLLRQEYISLEAIKRHFPQELHACPILTTTLDTEIVPIYGPVLENSRYFGTSALYSVDGLTQPISGQAVHDFSNHIKGSVCRSCDSFEHKSIQHFAREITTDEHYRALEALFDGTDSPYRAATLSLNTEPVYIPTAISTLYDIALILNPEEEPSYYCSDCGRGEDEDDYYDDEYSYRETSLSDHSRQRLQEIATEFNKVTKNYGNTIVFKHEEETIIPGNLYQYEVNSYDFGPSLTFVDGKDTARTKLYMGLEWEIDGGGEQHAKAVSINSALSGNQPYSWTMSDGSLSEGIEIATMPATLDAHTNTFNWAMACKVATTLNYRGHDTGTAGIHIHINRNFFSDDKKLQMYRASLMALVMERNWDDFAKFSRRRYNRLDQWARKKDVAVRNYEDTDVELLIDKTKLEYSNGDKYLALNMNRVKTFELRIFRSTTKPETILATLQFVSNLAHFCKYNGLKRAQTATIQDIVDYHKYPELVAYWNENKNREVQQ